eukprot:TRINITY_DN740_c0_g2_i1.p1 TRINITY_DN740_c0_g2~~TRINITY_DN740_c0_g2_i1.p1  ORF type:complete len:155 (+),score=34.94 TRINITY_DN740_c0_g2_i1:211-675(+)
MQKFEQPRNSDISLDKTHLGTLFMIDKSKDGRFYLDEIKQFVDLYFERQAANANTVDVVKEFQGYCTASLWNYVANQKGKETFVKWFGKLFSMGNIAIQGKDSKTTFVDRNAVMLIHTILNISKSYAIEGSQTLALFQGVAKHKVLYFPFSFSD